MVLPEESDPRLQGSWVPGTPAKPVLKRLAAEASGQGSNSTVLGWFRSAAASSDGHAGLRGFEELAVGLSADEAAVVALETCSPSCSNNVAVRAQPMGETIHEWSQVRYTDCVVPTNPATASSSVVASLPMFFHGSPMHGEGTSSSQILLNGTVMLSSDHLRDTETGPAASGAVAPPFAPVTPEKQKVAQDVGHPGSACSDDESKTVREGLCMATILPTIAPKWKGPIQLCFDNEAWEQADFVAAAEGLPSQLQESEIREDLVPKEKGPVQLCFDKGASEQADFVAQGLPSQLQENMIIEEVEKQGIDLNKTPQQKPRRKKHRPKVVQEGKPSRTPKSSTPKPDMSTKRKYTRRKGINSPLEAPSSEVAEQNVELDKRKRRGPAKRRLDFPTGDDKAAETLQRNTNSGSPEQVESLQGSSSNYATGNDKNDGKSTGMFIKGQEVPVNSSAGITPLLNPSNNQILETCLNSLDIPSLHLQPSRRELIRENLKKLARLRDSQDVQSHSGINHSEMQTDRRLTAEGSVSTSASNFLSTDETMMSARKMDNNLFIDGMQLYNENIAHVDFIHEKACNYDEMNGSLRGRNNSPAYLPEMQKKRRTGKGHNELAFNEVASFVDAQGLLEFEMVLAMEGKQAFRQRQIMLMKSLEAPTCNLASPRDNMKLPTALHNPNMHDQRLENGIIRGPQGCVEALAADTHAKVRAKRNRKKEQTQVASAKPSHANQLGLQEQDSSICSLRQKSGESISSSASNSEPKDLPVQVSSVQVCNNATSSHAMCRGCCFSDAMLPHSHGNETLHSLDIIVQKMKYLNINEDQGNKVTQEQTALVPFGAHGMIVPFEGPFYPIKKLRHRAKIVLDKETNRVWNLLMGKESNNGVEGTAADKEKWWKEERGVFHGRADSFIARMHLVQGDRRFSPWKGSVLDSVIGVFLTQNVADHLSSSAFMALAARFPPRSREKSGEASTSTEQDASVTAVHVAGKCSDKSVSDQNSGVDNGAEQMGEKAMHASRNNVGGDIFSCSKDKYSVDNPLIVAGDRNMIKANEIEPFECVHSSQNSVVSSQNSSGDPFLTIDQIGSSSEANSEAEYLITGKQCSLESKTSCMELLEMVENGTFHDLHKLGNRESSKTENFKFCETENFDSPSADNQEYGLPSGKERLYFPTSVASRINPISEIKVSGTEGFHSANATVSNHQNSTLASQSSPLGDLQAFTGDLAAQSLRASSIKADYGKHPCYFDGISSITTMGPTNNSFHNYSGLQEGMSTEVQPKQRRAESHSINVQIASEALSQTQHFRGHQFYSGSPPKQRPDVVECFTMVDKSKCVVNEGVELTSTDETCSSNKDTVGSASNAPRGKRGKLEKEKQFIDWDDLRRQVCENGARKERSSDTMDSLDWEAVRDADVNEISSTIRERGMNNKLAERIKGLLDRLMKEHGSIDLEWLRDVPPDKTKDFLLSIKGLGLKSVECVRLLTLHHLAFPVDTNVGRICVRLGWVPLQPLPESLQLHLLELYPMLETIQKYLWPRLCTLDQRTLYELHYQMITFGKVFCTKSKPNCNACPMRGECRHFASAFASARLPLPGPEDKSIVASSIGHNYKGFTHTKALPQLEGNTLLQEVHVVTNSEPIVEEPATPEPECTQIPDIEDAFYEDTDEIPAIKLNIEEFAQNLQNYMQQNDMELQDVDLSKALIAITPEAASIPVPKLKNVSRLRTEHQVYELPDSHPLLEGLDQREAHDPCPYLLAIWTPGETAQSTEPPESCCKAQGTGNLCGERTCFSCNSIREAQTQMVRGTLLIPCRTAMRGSFPLNGTYFQVNEVFADHESSLKPIDVPRGWIWNLPRRTVYFGTSIPTIFKGLAIADIQNCFWRGFVCVRGFDRKTRGPRPLMARLHFPLSKATRNKRPAAKDDGQVVLGKH